MCNLNKVELHLIIDSMGPTTVDFFIYIYIYSSSFEKKWVFITIQEYKMDDYDDSFQ